MALRQEFDLYANVRPARTYAGLPNRYDKVDLVVIRENTQGEYSGIEHYIDPTRSAAEAISIITRHGCDRIIRFAFEYARATGRKQVTLVHKANILKMTSGLFLETGREIARSYPDIQFDDIIVDNCAMQLVRDPSRFDVIVTTNLFGDILSDLTAGLVGGLGLVTGGNIGESAAIFEAVHGTAPDIAGKGVANPTAVMLAGAMLLDRMGQRERALRLEGGHPQGDRRGQGPDPRSRRPGDHHGLHRPGRRRHPTAEGLTAGRVPEHPFENPCRHRLRYPRSMSPRDAEHGAGQLPARARAGTRPASAACGRRA